MRDPAIRSTRIHRTGDFARVLAFGVSALFLGAIAIGLTALVPSTPAEWIAFGALVALFVWLPIRAATLGVWISPSGITARSWFRTWKFPPGSVRRCERVPYNGLLYGAGESKLVWMLKLSLYDGSATIIRSTIAPRKTSQKQVVELVSYLEAGSPLPKDVTEMIHFEGEAVIASNDFGLILRFERGTELRVEGAFAVTSPGSTRPAGSADARDFSPATLALLTGQVDTVAWSPDGVLEAKYSDGTLLTVPIDPDYEAWILVRANRELFVATPGGGVASFPPG